MAISKTRTNKAISSMQSDPVTSTSSMESEDIPSWYRPILFVILLGATFLNFFQLGQNGYANTYYAAAVRSMLVNWQNFFFVSFDPGGYVAIDKPPLGYWIQALSARVFGFSPWSLFLPQVLAAIFSVFLLAHLVRHRYGPVAALIAGLTLTLTPIYAVTSRNNTVDSMLVLVMLLGAWVITIATRTGRLRWLLLCAITIGLGFNIKMLIVYLILPAFGLLYLLAAPLKWRMRILHLFCAALVMLVVSLSWATLVDLTPASQRPYVGSSSNNSELYLALAYNGATRFGGMDFQPKDLSLKRDLALLAAYTPDEMGHPSLLRLFNDQLGGQIGWLLPFALLGLIGVKWRKPSILPLDQQQEGLTLWGAWFVTGVIVFSSSSYLHQYYLVLLAPAVAALVGISVVTTWYDLRQSTWQRWQLPVTFLLTAIAQVRLLWTYPTWGMWLIPLIVAASLLVGGAHMARRSSYSTVMSLTAGGLLVLLLAPAIWTAIPVFQNRSIYFPYAGPTEQPGPFEQLAAPYMAARSLPDPAQLRYVLRHSPQTPYAVATIDAETAAPIMLETGRAVMALDGWSGNDRIVTPIQLATKVQRGFVRFFLIPAAAATPPLPAQVRAYLVATQQVRQQMGFESDLAPWIRSSCREIPPSVWQNDSGAHNHYTDNTLHLLVLYDCATPSQ